MNELSNENQLKCERALDLALSSTSGLAGLALLRTCLGEEVIEIMSRGFFPEVAGEKSYRNNPLDTLPTASLSIKPKHGLFKLEVFASDTTKYFVICYFKPSFFSIFNSNELNFTRDLEVIAATNEIERVTQIANEARKELDLVSKSAAALLDCFETDAAPEAFAVTLEYLLNSFGVEHGSIWELHDQEYFTLEATCNSDVKQYKRNCFKKTHGLISRALLPGAPKIQKFRLDEGIPPSDLENKDMFQFYKGRDVHLIRLGSVSRPYGVACLVGNASTTLSEMALETVERLLAIELNSRRSEVTNRLFRAIQKLFKHNERTAEDICNFIVNQLLQIVNCQACTIVLKLDLNPKSCVMEVIASKVHLNSMASVKYNKFIAGEKFEYDVDDTSITGKIALNKDPYLSNNVSGDSLNSFNFCEVDDQTNDSWLGVPILTAANECIGVLRCKGKMAKVGDVVCNYIFDKQDLELITSAASILAPLLQHKVSSGELIAINERLEESERIREHEMRGPLQLISSQASFVNRHLDDSAVTSKSRRLEMIITNVELCSTLLTSTTLPNPVKFSTELQMVNLRKMMQTLIDVMRHQIEARSPSQVMVNERTGELEMLSQPYMVVEITGGSCFLIGHRDLLQRAFYNIASNAIKYAQPTKKGRLSIDIKTEVENNLAKITFKDFGIGIEPSESAKIFEGRFRGGNASNRPGEGIGLKIARSIIELHRGHLSLVNHFDPTVFEVELPLSLHY